jgi:hypothetical protein
MPTIKASPKKGPIELFLEDMIRSIFSLLIMKKFYAKRITIFFYDVKYLFGFWVSVFFLHRISLFVRINDIIFVHEILGEIVPSFLSASNLELLGKI